MKNNLNLLLMVGLLASLALNFTQCNHSPTGSGQAYWPITNALPVDDFPAPKFLGNSKQNMMDFLEMTAGKLPRSPMRGNRFPSLNDSTMFQVLAYDQWLKLLPNQMCFDKETMTIHYQPERVASEADARYLETLIGAFNRLHPRANGSINSLCMELAPAENMTTSFYISWEDLDAFRQIVAEHDSLGGIRFVNALNYQALLAGSPQGLAHGFVIPAQDSHTNWSGTRPKPLGEEGDDGVADLIAPCPNTCGDPPFYQ